jgi:hypothetical protein
MRHKNVDTTRCDQREGSHVSPSLSFPLPALLSLIPKMTPHLLIAPPAQGITCGPSTPADTVVYPRLRVIRTNWA